MSAASGPTEHDVGTRKGRMAVLARAPEALLVDAWQRLPDKPSITVLRAPETGLLMVRGRAGGTGLRFNIGEVAITRAAVALADGTTGYGYVLGQRPRHAELAACFDALAACGDRLAEIDEAVLTPAQRHAAAADDALRHRAEATRVDFDTLVREG